jgi:2-polyprenyl-3-methyl-5-hydroxy-6-metoxy-1,4-benzoquinol methylase
MKTISQADIKSYYDNFLDKLKKDHERANPRHTRAKQMLKSIIKPDMKVLDIGCGTGLTTVFMGEIGAQVIGIDISDKLIEFARLHSLHLPNVKYIVQDITQFCMSLNEKFDAITIIDLLEHIPRANFTIFLETIGKHSSENTIIYLNIPDSRYQRYMREKHPTRLQIIDEDYDSDFLISSFKRIGFQAYQYSIYGLDVPVQYNDYFFMTRQRLNEMYNQALKRIGLQLREPERE